MHKTLFILGVLGLGVAASGAQAQSINASGSHAVALSPTQLQQPEPTLHARLQPVMTRVVAHENADGSISAKCHVELSPVVKSGNGKTPHEKRKGVTH